MKRLQQNPTLLERYDAVIREQLQRGIVELVNEEDSSNTKRIHYLPHHAVVREDKVTSKVCIVYDASARSTGPSLNDCLHTGTSFGQHKSWEYFTCLFLAVINFCWWPHATKIINR